MKDLLNQYDIFIFDCDGVILDVNILKCEAFGKVVEGYPKKNIDDFVEHCRRSFGVSRYVKFKEFLSDFAKVPFEEKVYNGFLEKYASICNQIYRDAEITEGCISLFTELQTLKKRLYIASGSDEKELNQVFIDRNLIQYFQTIYGSPKTKLECIADILRNNLSKKAIFIGDAISDLESAEKYNIDFIYMAKYTVQSKKQDEICRKKARMVINSLYDLTKTKGD